jgi:pre-rRNA-processing protein TSR4
LFGSNSSPPFSDTTVHEDPSVSGSDSDDEVQDDGNLDAVMEKLATVTLKSLDLSPEWSSWPAYKPVYLSTISEYLPSSPKSKVKAEGFLDDDVDDNKKAGKDWGLEGWEKSMDVDGVFAKFLKRVSSENEQCVR